MNFKETVSSCLIRNPQYPILHILRFLKLFIYFKVIIFSVTNRWQPKEELDQAQKLADSGTKILGSHSAYEKRRNSRIEAQKAELEKLRLEKEKQEQERLERISKRRIERYEFLRKIIKKYKVFLNSFIDRLSLIQM